MAFQIVFRLTAGGLKPPEIQVDSEAEERLAAETLERIRPCLDVIDAILKRTGAGARG